MKKILIVALLLSGAAFAEQFTFANLSLDEMYTFLDRMKAHTTEVLNMVGDAQKAKVQGAKQAVEATLTAEEVTHTQGEGVVALRLAKRDAVMLFFAKPKPRDIHQETLDAVAIEAQAEIDRLQAEAELDEIALAAAIAALEAAQAEADAFQGEGG